MASMFLIASVFVFDLIAVGLAFAAERRRSTAVVTPSSDGKYDYCVYNSDIASGFGVGALLFLLLSQLIVVFGTRCFCCGRALRPGAARSCALILFLLSWVTFLIAEACLLAGAVRNAYHTRFRSLFGREPLSCQTLRKGVFAAGAVFAFATAILTELYYISFSRANRPYDSAPSYGGPPKDGGVAMGAYR